MESWGQQAAVCGLCRKSKWVRAAKCIILSTQREWGRRVRKKTKKLQDPKGHRVIWGRQDKFPFLTLVMLCHSLVESILNSVASPQDLALQEGQQDLCTCSGHCCV